LGDPAFMWRLKEILISDAFYLFCNLIQFFKISPLQLELIDQLAKEYE